MFTAIFAPVLCLFAGALVAAQTNAKQQDVFKPTRYIVEFSDMGSAKFRKRDGTLDSSEGFMRILQDSGADVESAFDFTSSIFHGASFDLKNATEESMAYIQSLPEVAKVWPAAYITLGFEHRDFVQDSSQLVAWDPHRETNVSTVHGLGHMGEGVVVAVIDSGIDYTHPALGGGLGPGFKVESGWDFTTDTPDPKDCYGHGTHVAGIIGSDDKFIKGVAPKARLRGYKVFGCVDGTTEDMAIAAFLRAYEEGADVINGSLGADRGFPDAPIAVVLSRIQAQGVLVVVAAGNSGVQGPFFTTNLGNNYGGLTVGSIEHDTLIAYEVSAYSTSGESRSFLTPHSATKIYVSSDSQPFKLSGNVSASWAPGKTADHNACLPYVRLPEIPNENLVVLPRNSLCDWQSHDNHLDNKADWAFWYNFEGAEYEVPRRYLYDSSVQAVGTALISYEDGTWLVSQHENGYNITYVLQNATEAPVAVERPSWKGGRLNAFSSWGPTLDARTKPEVVAPGGSIFNAYPGGGWVSFSGTSMASPYVAGLAALVLSAHGTRTERDDAAAFARRRIISSGRAIRHPDGSDMPASVGQQGAGLVNAVKAVLHTTSVNPSHINLNDTEYFQPSHEIQITNEGEEKVTYSLAHTNQPTYFARNPSSGLISVTPSYSQEVGDSASVNFSVTELTVGPGETVSFEVTFTEPETSGPESYPVYGGGIAISGDNGESVKISYMGIKGSINNFPHWAGDQRPFLTPTGQEMTDGATYTFSGSDAPYAPFTMAWSTRQFSFDFVDRAWTAENWTYPPIAGENLFYGSFRTAGDGNQFVEADFPINSFPRGAAQYYARPTATLSNGVELVDGEYRYLRRSLKTFGNPGRMEDWQYDLSPWFRLERG